jgi:hypothetical protein
MFVVCHVASGTEMSFSTLEAMAEAEAKKLGKGYAVVPAKGYAAKVLAVFAKKAVPGMPESWCAGESFA